MGRCVSQIGRRFHWLRTRDDTWPRVAAFYLAKTVVFMHFTIKEKGGERGKGVKKKKNETERANGNLRSEGHGISR